MQHHITNPARLLLSFLLAALVVFAFGARVAMQDTTRQFESEGNAYQQRLGHSLNASDALLTALVGGYQASTYFDSARNALLARELMRSYKHIDFVGYLSWINPGDKQDFESEMHLEGTVGFRIRGIADHPQKLSGKLGHMTLRFVEPLSIHFSRLLGLDLAVNGQMTELLDTTIASGDTGRAYLDPSPWGDDAALVSVKATYKGLVIPRGESERRAQFDGAFMLVHQLERIKSLAGGLFSAADIQVVGRQASAANVETDSSSQVFWHLNEGLLFEMAIDLPGTGRQLLLQHKLPWTEVWGRNHIVLSLGLGIVLSLLLMLGDYRRDSRMEVARANARANEERERAQATLVAIGDAVITVSKDWKIDYINPEAERLLDVHLGQVRGALISQHVHLRNSDSGALLTDLPIYFSQLLRRTEPTPVHLLTSDHREIAIDSRVTHLTGEEGGFVIVMRDVSIERELTEELAFQASHDMLTGLLNRTAFEGSVKAAIQQAQNADTEHAIVYIDLDRFKLVNDSGGHAAGDEVLKRVAGILQAQLRDGDVLARIGGDEFGVLLHRCELAVAIEVAERLRNSIADFRFRWHEKLFDIEASLGVVPITPDSGPIDDVLTAVDLACHVAKERGRNSLHVHRTEDDIVDRRRAEMRWLPRLKDALASDRFDLFLQPISPIDPAAGLPQIHEFLVRLRDTDGKFIRPALFIPSAERYDLIREIDRWVIAAACDLLAQSAEQHAAIYSINLSGQSIGDEGLTEYVQKQLERTGVSAGTLAFELTETSAIANLARAQEFVARIRALGCKIMLDDFGSGLSSFGYLKNLRLDYIKIDGQFVRDMVSDPVDEAMVRMIHEIAEVLRVRTVAEWIEDAEIMEKVRRIGIDYGQGFFIARPVPARDVIKRELRLVT